MAQLSTLPSWMFIDGLPLNKTSPDPWQPNLDYGRTGGKLRDSSCGRGKGAPEALVTSARHDALKHK